MLNKQGQLLVTTTLQYSTVQSRKGKASARQLTAPEYMLNTHSRRPAPAQKSHDVSNIMQVSLEHMHRRQHSRRPALAGELHHQNRSMKVLPGYMHGSQHSRRPEVTACLSGRELPLPHCCSEARTREALNSRLGLHK